MSTLFYRLFGLGKIPKNARPALEKEGVVLIDEGIGGSLVFTRFRAPGRYYGKKFSCFTGSLVLTKKRFAAYTCYPFFNPIIDIPLDDERLRALQLSLKDEKHLRIDFNPAAFHRGWSGKITCRFTTPRARAFMRKINQSIV